jgi:hypothetical protein
MDITPKGNWNKFYAGKTFGIRQPQGSMSISSYTFAVQFSTTVKNIIKKHSVYHRIYQVLLFNLQPLTLLQLATVR